MTQTLIHPRAQPAPPADATAAPPAAIRTPGRQPGRRRPGVSAYRLFMLIVFTGIVLVDSWFDQHLSSVVSADVIGPISVVVWALTLLGSLGLGPFALVKKAMR